MSDVKEMIVKGIIYSFKDAAARGQIAVVSQNVQALQADVNRIYSDFAEYDKVDHPDIIFGTPTQTGAIVNANGAVVPMEGYNISNPISVTKGLLYKLFVGVGATIPAGIAVFAIRRVSEDGRVVYTPAFVSNNTTKVSRLGYLVFFASENAEIVASYPASTNKLEVAEYGVLKSLAKQIDNLRKEVDLKSFADGYYAQMSVGYARNLIMPNTPTEQEFSHRQSGGGVIESGVSTYDKIMGRSLVWNNVGLNWTQRGSAIRNIVGNTIQYKNVEQYYGAAVKKHFIAWHKYLIAFNIHIDSAGETVLYCGFHTELESPNTDVFAIYYGTTRVERIITLSADAEYFMAFNWSDGNADYTIGEPFIIDLTQMFNAGNEPTTYEEFLQRKPIVEDEFAFNEGTIINNKVEKVVSRDTEGNEVGTFDLSWIKDIKDENGVALFEDGPRGAGTAFDEVKAKEATKRMGVKVFDGTENWDYNEQAKLFDASVELGDKQVYAGINYLCNKYINSFDAAYSGLGFYRGASSLVFGDNNFTTLVSWKQYLADLYAAGTPLVVYYELAEPIVVEYPEKSMSLEVVAGGTETAIATEPSTPMRAMISYGIDAVATILSLVRRVTELEGKINN